MLNFWLSTMFSIHHMWLFTFSVGKSLQKNTHFSLLMLLFFFRGSSWALWFGNISKETKSSGDRILQLTCHECGGTLAFLLKKNIYAQITSYFFKFVNDIRHLVEDGCIFVHLNQNDSISFRCNFGCVSRKCVWFLERICN